MWNINNVKQFKATVITAFDATKKGYGSNGDFHWNHAKKLVELAHIQSGQQILDVATGTAPAAIMAAQIVGPTGHVTGLDISPGMLEQAKQNLKLANLTETIDLIEGDAEKLNFGEESFDIVLCVSAVPWFSDIPQAFREFYRVLKSNGHLIFSCWGGEAKAIRTNILNEILEPYGQSVPELNGRINSLEKCKTLLTAAGFNSVEIVIDDRTTNFQNIEKDFLQNWPGISSRFNISLSREDIEKIKTNYMAKFEQDSIKIPGWNQDYTQFITAKK